MTDAEYISRRIELLRPRAKFVAFSHSNEFIDKSANLGDGFHYANLYDEQIDSNVISSPRGLLMIHNTYLSSFAYNLLLCRLLYAGDDSNEGKTNLKRLLKHNFKKYFAEQLFAAHNNIFSRAILLETLLYEQQMMVPVFGAKARDESLSRNADIGAQLMSSALSFHELGHFYLDNTPQLWDEILANFPDVLTDLYKEVSENYPSQFVEEFRCDIISAISCFDQYQTETDKTFRLRLIVFSFAAFAVLYSLTKSAQKTTSDKKSVGDEVDFESIEKKHIEYDYTIGLDLDFIERAKLVKNFCRLLAEKENLKLYEKNGIFPLEENILEDLLSCVDFVMESDDPNARSLSLLVAEAFHNHSEGMEYLYLRSKTFVFGSDRNADGNLKNHK